MSPKGASGKADLNKQPVTEDCQVLRRKEICHFFRPPAEVRLQIYQYALPANKLFTPWHTQDYDGTEMALLTTCKLIYQEAFPIFLSNNNFTIDGLCSSDYPEGHTFFNNVSEVTFEWHHVRKIHRNQIARIRGRLNVDIVRDLFKYPKLKTIRVLCHWNRGDEDYKPLESNYGVDGFLDNYLKRTGLEALISIPGIQEVTFHHSLTGEATPELLALKHHISKHLEYLRSEALHVPALSKREVLSIIKEAFRDKEGRDASSEDDD